MANYDIEKLKKVADIVGKIGTGMWICRHRWHRSDRSSFPL